MFCIRRQAVQDISTTSRFNILTLVLLISLCSGSITVYAQDSENINEINELFWAWEYPTGAAYFQDDEYNDYLALSTGSTGLGLLNINDALHPEHVANYETDLYAYQVAAKWPNAVLGEENRIRVIDLSDPEHLICSSTLELAGAITKLIAVNDTVFYASGDFDSLYVINLSNPNEPFLENTLILNGSCNDMSISETTIVVCTSEESVLYDVSNPLIPSALYTFTDFAGSEKAALSDEYLAIQSGDTLRVYNMDTTSSPVMEVEVEEEWAPYGWKDNELHVISNNYLKIIGIEENGIIGELFSYRASQGVTDPERGWYLDVLDYEMSLNTGYLICWKSMDAGETNVDIIDIKPVSSFNPRWPWIGEYYADYYKMKSSIRKDNFIYIAASAADIRILEVLEDNTVIEHPPFKHIIQNSYITDVASFGDSLYFMSFIRGDFFREYQYLCVSDISNRTTPEHIDELFSYDTTSTIHPNGNCFAINPFLSYSPSYLRLHVFHPQLDSTFSSRIIWDEEFPRILGYSTLVNDINVYVSYNWDRNERNGFFTLQLARLTDISNFIEVDGHALSLKMDHDRDYLYLCNADNGILIYDLQNNPLNPDSLTTISTGGYAKYVDLVGNYAFVVCEDIGLEVYDLTDIYNPELTGWFYDTGVFNHVTVVDSVAHLTSDRHFYMLDCINAMGGTSGVADEVEIIPTEHVIYPPYPNPFNSTSNVKVELKSPSWVMIKAFDILGRELFHQNQFLPQGTHRIPLQFDMENRSIASGPIIVRVETAKSNQVFKIFHLQ